MERGEGIRKEKRGNISVEERRKEKNNKKKEK